MVFYRKRKQADVGVFGVKVRLAISRARWPLHESTYRSIDSKFGRGLEQAFSLATTDWVISATEALFPMSCPWHRAGRVASQRCRAYERFWLGALWFAHTPLFLGVSTDRLADCECRYVSVSVPYIPAQSARSVPADFNTSQRCVAWRNWFFRRSCYSVVTGHV